MAQRHCPICGEVLTAGAIAIGYYRDTTCGSEECEREMRDQQRQEEADAYERAREDDFERYR